LKGFGGV